SFSLLLFPPPPCSSFFPYTTLFRSLSVVLCGASLAFQSLTVGGVIFLLLVLRGSGRDSEDTKDSCLGWIRRFALALSAMQTSHLDRKSTRLNSSHQIISYAVFCLKK